MKQRFMNVSPHIINDMLHCRYREAIVHQVFRRRRWVRRQQISRNRQLLLSIGIAAIVIIGDQ